MVGFPIFDSDQASGNQCFNGMYFILPFVRLLQQHSITCSDSTISTNEDNEETVKQDKTSIEESIVQSQVVNWNESIADTGMMFLIIYKQELSLQSFK